MNVFKRFYVKARREFLKKIVSQKSKHVDSGAHIALVSCDAWAGRVYDDLLLQKAFLDSGVKADIVSWQNKKLNYNKYDALLITSMWGYQNYIHDFEKWLDEVRNLKVFNPVKIIRENYDKLKQIAILEKNHLPTVPTKIVKMLDSKDEFSFPVILKPSISGSGENTFLVNNYAELESIMNKLQEINKDRDILVQPFLPEINNGEISVIVIDKKIVNAVVRFPGIVGDSKKYIVKPLDVDNLDADLIKLCEKIIDLNEYRDELYMRIDVVKKNNTYIIMEVELFEPQLFYYLLKGKARKTMLDTMVESLKKRL